MKAKHRILAAGMAAANDPVLGCVWRFCFYRRAYG